jgi:hypothetical protein
MKMKGTILLNYNENTRQIEEEEKSRFLRSLLEQTGVPIQDIWTTDEPLSFDQRIKLRSLLSNFNVQVIDDHDGGLQVFVENEKIAEWFKPLYKLKKDLSQRDRKKQLFLEMSIEYWSLFEESEDPKE